MPFALAALFAFQSAIPFPLLSETSSLEGLTNHPLVVWVVTAIISLVVSVAVTWGGQRERIRALSDETKGLRAALETLEKSLVQLRIDRADCAKECAQTFSTRSELARLIGDQTIQSQRIHERLDQVAEGIDAKLSKIHGRINDVSNEVAALGAQNPGGKPL